MKRKLSKIKKIRKFGTTSRGCPLFGNFGKCSSISTTGSCLKFKPDVLFEWKAPLKKAFRPLFIARAVRIMYQRLCQEISSFFNTSKTLTFESIETRARSYKCSRDYWDRNMRQPKLIDMGK